MYLPNPTPTARAYAYRSWTCDAEGGNGVLNPLTVIQPGDSYAGYVCIDVTDSNIAIVGGHEQVQPDPDRYSTVYWDTGPCFGFFTKRWATPNDNCGNTGEKIWPSTAYHDRGTDSRTYVFACESTDGIMHQFVLYVKIGFEETETDLYTYCIDTGSTISQMVAAHPLSDRVGLAWTANRPHDGDPATMLGRRRPQRRRCCEHSRCDVSGRLPLWWWPTAHAVPLRSDSMSAIIAGPGSPRSGRFKGAEAILINTLRLSFAEEHSRNCGSFDLQL